MLHAEDGLSDDEVRDLRRSIYCMSLVSGADTVDTLIRYVRTNHVKDDDCDISEVIGAFRKELRLEQLADTTLINLEAIEAKLRGDLEPDIVKLKQNDLNQFTNDIFENLLTRFPEQAKGASTSKAYGTQNGLDAFIECQSGLTCYVSVEYQRQGVSGFFEFEDLHPKKRMAILKSAINIGLLQDTDSPFTMSFSYGEAAGCDQDETEASIAHFPDMTSLTGALAALEEVAQRTKA